MCLVIITDYLPACPMPFLPFEITFCTHDLTLFFYAGRLPSNCIYKQKSKVPVSEAD